MPTEGAGENIAGDAPDLSETVEGDTVTVTETGELERTLGLSGGLAIGIGTMIGAGIFVFPGLAGAEVGTAATASFAVGGLMSEYAPSLSSLLFGADAKRVAAASMGPVLVVREPKQSEASD